MPQITSPKSLSVIARPTVGFGDEPPADGTERSPEEADLALVETTRAYLACLAGGGVPGPALASAWDEFYRTYAPLVVRIVRRRCGRAGDPDDRAQDVWQAIVTRLVAFRPDPTRGPFRAWVLVVAQRRLADRLRGDARKIQPMTWDEPPNHVEGAEEDPAVTCERDDERALFAGLLAQLRTQVTPLSYRVLQLRVLEGRAVSEVARQVGLTADQVRARHHRTVAKLRRLAGPAEDHDPAMARKISRKSPTAAQQRPAP
jgi:RNA polymerase sigma factor (sigma-70 family)